VAAHAVEDATEHGLASGGDEFCSNDVPLLAVLQLIQDTPAAQQLVVAADHDFGFLSISASAFRLARTARPSPGVSFSLRIVRLTL
jgi:hypothetical protein